MVLNTAHTYESNLKFYSEGCFLGGEIRHPQNYQKKPTASFVHIKKA